MTTEIDLSHETPFNRRTPNWGSSLVTVCLAVVSVIAGGVVGGLVLQRQTSSQPPQAAGPTDSGSPTPPTTTAPLQTAMASAVPDSTLPDGSADPTTIGPAGSAGQGDGATSPPPATPTAQNPPDSGIPTAGSEVVEDIMDVQAVANALQRADDRLLETSYAVALRSYQELLPHTTGTVNAHVRFRLALCAEMLDDTTTAREYYESVISANADPVLTRLARLGQIRTWERAGQLDVAIAALYREIAAQETEGPGAVGIEEALHQLGHCLTRRVAPAASLDPLDPNHLLTPRPVVSPRELLALVRESAPARTELPREGLVVTQRLAPFAESVFLKVRYRQRAVADVFRALVTACGWTPEVTPDAVARMVGRSVSLDAPELSLAFLLDAILEPLGLAWKLTGSRIVVFEPEDPTGTEERQRRRMVAARALQYAVTNAPDHSWAAVSYMMLGELAASSGHTADAMRIFRQATRLYPRSQTVADAWFNLGKVQLLLADHEAALESFYRAVDNVETHPLERLAYLYIGRILLERDEIRKAIMPLRRALALNEGTDLEAVAGMMLSSAYLMLGNPRGANSILMTRRELLRDPAVRDQAAFLASLIRFRAASDPEVKGREAVTLIMSLPHADPARMFGGHWWILVGEAFRDVGMSVEEVALYERCLRTTYRFPLRDQLLLVLAERRLQQGDSINTRQLLEALSSDDVLHSSHAAEVMLAEIAYSAGDPQMTIERCGLLLQRESLPESVRPQVLKLMGRAFQAQGDYRSAIYCFSGLMPGAFDQREPVPSARQLEVVR